MAWWNRFFKQQAFSNLPGSEYRVAFNLYSEDGKRHVEVRTFDNGETYLVELELIDGAIIDRHNGRLVGPFASPEEAEKFIVGTAWFTDRKG